MTKKKHWNLTILELIRKNFTSKKAIDLMSVNIDQIVPSNKFNYEAGFKYFIGYQKGEIVKHDVLFYLKWVGI